MHHLRIDLEPQQLRSGNYKPAAARCTDRDGRRGRMISSFLTARIGFTDRAKEKGPTRIRSSGPECEKRDDQAGPGKHKQRKIQFLNCMMSATTPSALIVSASVLVRVCVWYKMPTSTDARHSFDSPVSESGVVFTTARRKNGRKERVTKV